MDIEIKDKRILPRTLTFSLVKSMAHPLFNSVFRGGLEISQQIFESRFQNTTYTDQFWGKTSPVLRGIQRHFLTEVKYD